MKTEAITSEDKTTEKNSEEEKVVAPSSPNAIKTDSDQVTRT